jgi:3-isopropylmalate/(R)-2-methylmalate dehydratase small subunit
MRPFNILNGVAAPLLRPNVDTDAIIPSREMKGVSKKGLAVGLFAGWRYTSISGREPDRNFVLNDPAHAGATILLCGENFGCGSSREHAVWALAEYGFRAVIAPSFSPIFQNNCLQNGILAARAPIATIERLAAEIAPDPQNRLVAIDLHKQTISTLGAFISDFEIAQEAKAMLLQGLDAIALTLKSAPQIDAFRTADRLERPWVYFSK